MKIYCMSDIHGYYAEFMEALDKVLPHLDEAGTMLLLLGDYVHGGIDGKAVLEEIIRLQERYGSEKVVALMGNHEEMVLSGESCIAAMRYSYYDDDDDKYLKWMENLPRYYTAGNTIFVHAGICEDTGDEWEYYDEEFTTKYPAQIGGISGIDKKVVAGHISTSEISGDPRFHDIYFDGESHYYIDGAVHISGEIPVLLVDTETDQYYCVTETACWIIPPYGEE